MTTQNINALVQTAEDDSLRGSTNAPPSKGANVSKAFSVHDFGKTYGVGHTKVFEEIKSGRLKTYKVGRRRYISEHAADAWQRQLEAETSNQREGA